MSYIADKLGTLDKIKLIKMIYIADRKCFIEHGCPITRDRQVAMPWGPVPSGCLDLIDGNLETDEPFIYLRVENKTVSPTSRAKEASAALTKEEKQALDEVIEEYKDMPTWSLVRLTHRFPEYRTIYQEGTSTTIPYELILELHGDESHFRHGRPVISQKMAACMLSPFEKSEPDL